MKTLYPCLLPFIAVALGLDYLDPLHIPVLQEVANAIRAACMAAKV
jgi:hypothetical protein